MFEAQTKLQGTTHFNNWNSLTAPPTCHPRGRSAACAIILLLPSSSQYQGSQPLHKHKATVHHKRCFCSRNKKRMHPRGTCGYCYCVRFACSRSQLCICTPQAADPTGCLKNKAVCLMCVVTQKQTISIFCVANDNKFKVSLALHSKMQCLSPAVRLHVPLATARQGWEQKVTNTSTTSSTIRKSPFVSQKKRLAPTEAKTGCKLTGIGRQ